MVEMRKPGEPKQPTEKQINLLRKLDPLAEEIPATRKEAFLRISFLLHMLRDQAIKPHAHRFRSKKWHGNADTLVLWCKRCGYTILQKIEIKRSKQSGQDRVDIKRIKRLKKPPRMAQDQPKPIL